MHNECLSEFNLNFYNSRISAILITRGAICVVEKIHGVLKNLSTLDSAVDVRPQKEGGNAKQNISTAKVVLRYDNISTKTLTCRCPCGKKLLFMFKCMLMGTYLVIL